MDPCSFERPTRHVRRQGVIRKTGVEPWVVNHVRGRPWVVSGGSKPASGVNFASVWAHRGPRTPDSHSGRRRPSSMASGRWMRRRTSDEEEAGVTTAAMEAEDADGVAALVALAPAQHPSRPKRERKLPPTRLTYPAHHTSASAAALKSPAAMPACVGAATRT